MKVRYKQVKYNLYGEVWISYYIKLYKHWWSLWWHVETDEYFPTRYDLIDGEYIRRL